MASTTAAAPPPPARASVSSVARAASAPTTPFGPGCANIWTDVIEHNKRQAKERGDAGRPDAVLFVLGAKGAGKTTLVQRFLYPDRADAAAQPPRPTEGMEYNYARRLSPTNPERKDVTHVYEMAGARAFADEATNQDNVFMGMRQVTTAVVLITVDLSRPWEAIPSLSYWLGRVYARCAATFSRLEARGSRLPEQLRQRAARNFLGGKAHEDAESGIVVHSGVAVVIAATKYDQFKHRDAEEKKMMNRALRFFAHAHGASLFYLGGLGGHAGDKAAGRGANASANAANVEDPYADAAGDKARLARFRAFLNHLTFVGADKKFPSKVPLETDHLKPATAQAGADSLRDIGAPRATSGGAPGGGAANEREAQLRAWESACAKMFPAPRGARGAFWVDGGAGEGGEGGAEEGGGGASAAARGTGFPEPDVDAARERKLEELAAFRRQRAAARAQPAVGAAAEKFKRRAA